MRRSFLWTSVPVAAAVGIVVWLLLRGQGGVPAPRGNDGFSNRPVGAPRTTVRPRSETGPAAPEEQRVDRPAERATASPPRPPPPRRTDLWVLVAVRTPAALDLRLELFERDPRTADGGAAPEGPVAVRDVTVPAWKGERRGVSADPDGRRVVTSVRWKNVPTHRPLWLRVSGLDDTPDPLVRSSLRRLGPPPASGPWRVTVPVVTGGWVVGRVLSPAGGPAEDIEIAVEPPRTATVAVDGDGGRFVVGPAEPGRIVFRVAADVDGIGYGRRFEATVGIDRATDLGDLVLGEDPTLLGVVVDEGGRPVRSEVLVKDAAERWLCYVATGDDGAFVMDADLEGASTIEAVPVDSARFAPTGPLPFQGGGSVRLTVRRREAPLVDVLVEPRDGAGRRLWGLLLAVVRRAGVAHVRSAHASRGVDTPGDPFLLREIPPGRAEVWLWMPRLGLASFESVEIVAGGVGPFRYEPVLHPTGAAAVGTWRDARCRLLAARVLPPDAAEDPGGVRVHPASTDWIEPGPFRLDGLPTGRPFRLLLETADGRRVLDRALRLGAGETVDLGELEP